MTNASEKKNKTSKIKELIIFLIIASVFIAPRVLSEQKNNNDIQAIQEKLGTSTFNQFMKSLSATGYSAFCLKKHNDQKIHTALKSYHDRNEYKSLLLIDKIEKNTPLSIDEKDALDKHAYKKLKDDIDTHKVTCESLATEINNGFWDL